MLDQVDLRILSVIDTDARITYAKLAKKAETTKSRVQYRLNNLIEKGIIKKFVTQPSLSKLGFFLAKFYLTTTNITAREKETFLNELVQEKNICWVAKTEGAWDVMLGAYVSTIKELNDFKKKFLKKHWKIIESIEVILAGEGYTSPRNYLFKQDNYEAKVVRDFIGDQIRNISLDKEDKAILKHIADNARYNLVDIHKETNLDVKTIRKRIDQMKEQGIIQGFVTFIDTRKINYQYFKICITLANHEAMEEVITFGIKHQNVIHIIETIGPWEIEFEIETKNIDSLFRIQEELRDQFPSTIKKTNVIIITEEKKLRFIPENL